MTCGEVNKHLDQVRFGRSVSLSEEVAGHLQTCARCRALWDFLAGPEPSPHLSESARTKIADTVLRTLKPVSPLPGAVWLTTGFLLIFALLSASFVAVLGLRGAEGSGAIRFPAMLAVLGGAVFFLALLLSREMVPGEKKILAPAGLFSILLASLFLTVLGLFPWRMEGNFLTHGWHCYERGFLFSLPAAGLIVWFLRRGAVLSPKVAGAAAGLLAGLVGVTVLHFGCSMYAAPHIALSHLGVALTGAVLGGLIGHWVGLVWPSFRSGITLTRQEFDP